MRLIWEIGSLDGHNQEASITLLSMLAFNRQHLIRRGA